MFCDIFSWIYRHNGWDGDMRILALIMTVMLALGGRASAADDKLIVFAAASLTEALGDVGRAYAQSGKTAPAFSFAASSALARQIENGAPAALFMSADEDWMDYLDKRHLIVDGTRVPLLGNTLVLITPADRPLAITIAPHFDLAGALGDGKLAMADPRSVPAGLYGKAALQKLGVWDAVSPKVIHGENVRTALTFVERGEAKAGIVYGSDAALTPKVKVVATFPADSHPPISYPLAIVKGHDSAAARDFARFVASAPARAIFTRYGFTPKPAP
jgi:molybdate transport system substrate-binding protein